MVWYNPTPSELAAHWIADVLDDPDPWASRLAMFLLSDFPEEEPELTWDTVCLLVRSYPEADFYAETKTEAQKVCGRLAAGPVEDLLSFHGAQFIERFENEAIADRRMAWMLGGTCQFKMSDDIWSRVQKAADHSYWRRNVAS